jgi:polyisoprenoid-binding protein YceI
LLRGNVVFGNLPKSKISVTAILFKKKNKMKILKPAAALLLLLFANITFAQKYTVTDQSSTVHFVIKNFGIKTGGDFTGLNGTITFDPKALGTSQFNVTVNSNTIDTDNNARDKHLRKSEYFDVEKYPVISFLSTKITESSITGRLFVTGVLTIKGVSKVVQFGFTATPSAVGYTFKGEFEINRRDYGVGGSSVSLADKLKVSLDIAAKK